MKPSSETEFFYEGSLTRLEFVAGPDGRAKEVLFFPEGADEPDRGVREGDVPSAPAEVKVDPALYDLYAGEYELAPGFVLTVRRDGARLLTQATGQQEFEVFPVLRDGVLPEGRRRADHLREGYRRQGERAGPPAGRARDAREAEEVAGGLYSFAARATSSSLFSRTCDEAGDSSLR